jgi:hypothetical protein
LSIATDIFDGWTTWNLPGIFTGHIYLPPGINPGEGTPIFFGTILLGPRAGYAALLKINKQMPVEEL